MSKKKKKVKMYGSGNVSDLPKRVYDGPTHGFIVMKRGKVESIAEEQFLGGLDHVRVNKKWALKIFRVVQTRKNSPERYMVKLLEKPEK